MKKFGLLVITLALVSCSSQKAKDEGIEEVEHDDIEKDYIVTDASQNIRPTWTADAEAWAIDSDKSVKKYRFYSYETEAKNSREISCQLANANAKAIVAGEITTFIQRITTSRIFISLNKTSFFKFPNFAFLFSYHSPTFPLPSKSGRRIW